MRKKIFIIHGKGVVDGIGVEGGGDLDTVGSNAFYSAWFNGFFKNETGADPVYGKDYAFDFVNYSEGLAHLAAHRGCDIYIPDFPIDALAPRLCFCLAANKETALLKNRLAQLAVDSRLRVKALAPGMDSDIKNIFNEIIKKIPGLRKKDDNLTLKAASIITEKVLDLMLDPSVKSSDTISLLCGTAYQKLKQEIIYLNTLINDFLSEQLNLKGETAHLAEPVLKALRRSLFMIEKSENIHALILEALSMPQLLSDLVCFCDNPQKADALKELSNKFKADFSDALTDIPLKGIDQILPLLCEQAHNPDHARHINPENTGPENTDSETRFIVHLTEDSTGCPVKDIPVQFTLPGEKNKKIIINTDDHGTASVKCARAFATYDDIANIAWPPGSPAPLTEEPSKPGNAEAIDFVTELEGPQAPEDESQDSPVTDKVTAVALKLIERDIRFLTANDVRLIRFDDHHPWTPEIHSLLKNLEKEGLIGLVHIHAYERGREMEKDQAKCGADLIYEGLIKDTPMDNPGLKELKRLAHVQDLHIEEDKLAIDLSKLIGSGFSKIQMAKRLGQVKSYDEMINIMSVTAWEKEVKAYEDGLEIVLPRLFRTMAHVTVSETDEKGKKEFYKILMILAPFTDRKAGEAKINVASAINFLKDKVEIDYLFYCYGSMMMTTRKVTDREAPVDLSLMSQHVGTKADGGHAEAATCKPGSNPGFPAHLFSRLDDGNFLEYAAYIGGLVSEKFHLNIENVNDVKCPFYEDSMMPLLDLITPSAYFCTFTPSDSGPVKMAFIPAPRASKKAELVQPTTGAAIGRFLSDLDGTDQIPDYLFYCRGGSRISIRKTSSKSVNLDLGLIARAFKNPPDSAQTFSACIATDCDPDFDSKRYRFTSNENFPDFLGYLLDRISGSLKAKPGALKTADLKSFFNTFSDASDFVEKAAKKAALLRVIKKKESGYEKNITGLAKLIKPIGFLLPGDIKKDYYKWLYSLNSKNCFNIIVVSPPGAGNYNTLKECPLGLLVWGLKKEFEFDYMFTTAKNSSFCMLALNDDVNNIQISKIANLIDTGELDTNNNNNNDNSNNNNINSIIIPAAGAIPFKSRILPAEFKRVSDDNYALYLDWLCRCMETAAHVEVISVSRARTS
jgi:hypothetical protein